MTFEYDERKNLKNLRKHKISIPELITIFKNKLQPPSMDHFDRIVIDRTGKKEIRYHAYGWTTTGWYVKIWYCYRDDKIRIIGGKKLK